MTQFWLRLINMFFCLPYIKNLHSLKIQLGRSFADQFARAMQTIQIELFCQQKHYQQKTLFRKSLLQLNFLGVYLSHICSENNFFSRLLKFYFKIMNYKLASQLDIKIYTSYRQIANSSQSINQSINQSTYFKERLKLDNLQI